MSSMLCLYPLSHCKDACRRVLLGAEVDPCGSAAVGQKGKVSPYPERDGLKPKT